MRPKILSIVAAPPGWQIVLNKQDGGFAFHPMPCFVLVEQQTEIRSYQSVEPFYFSLDGIGHVPRVEDPDTFIGVVPPGMSAEEWIQKLHQTPAKSGVLWLDEMGRATEPAPHRLPPI
jgi:hypothetical protein